LGNFLGKIENCPVLNVSEERKAAALATKNAHPAELLEKIFRTAYKIRVFETEGISLSRQRADPRLI